ncbi:hypothetical protein J6590_003835 [Homalodisca vitripennis]|nr:hypothetical protein J6590_003835 [Homalodisca vitripennis]
MRSAPVHAREIGSNGLPVATRPASIGEITNWPPPATGREKEDRNRSAPEAGLAATEEERKTKRGLVLSGQASPSLPEAVGSAGRPTIHPLSTIAMALTFALAAATPLSAYSND